MKGKFRFFIMFMLTMIYFINYVDRGALSYTQQFMIEEYGLNAFSWGQVLGFFGYGYIFGGFFGGLLADKKGPKFTWILAVILWSVSAMMLGIAGNIGIALFGGSALIGFAVFRVIFGFFEGPINALQTATIGNWAATKDKAFMNSIGFLGVPLGALFTAPIAVFLISLVGWKGMYVVLGLVGIIWALVWAKFFTNHPEDNKNVSPEELSYIRADTDLYDTEKTISETSQAKKPWYHFFKHPTLIFNVLAQFSFQIISFINLTWTPKYLQDEFNFELSSLWYLGMIPWVGACITILLGARLSDMLLRKTNNLRIARTSVGIVSYFLTAICFSLILTVNSSSAVLILMMIANGLAFLPSTLFWVIILDTAPERAGAYGGITHFFVYTAAIVAPTLTGYLVMKYGYDAMFITAASAALLSMIFLFFVKPGKKEGTSITPEHSEITTS
jgi:sugar phosphate permease